MDHEDFEKRGEKKKMRLPVYHTPSQRDNVVTIKLNINPRQVERFFFITLVLCLLAVIIVQPGCIFDRSGIVDIPELPIETGEVPSEIEAAAPITETPPTDPVPAETPPIENTTTPAVEPPVENTTTPVTVEAVQPSKIAFQITDFIVEKRSETWYKIQGVEIKVTNNGGTFKPTVKIWYYDDATKHYFDEDTSPVKDQQSFSTGIAKGDTRTFKLNNIDESFSGSELNPTILAKLYDLQTGNVLKEITEKIEWDESDFD